MDLFRHSSLGLYSDFLGIPSFLLPKFSLVISPVIPRGFCQRPLHIFSGIPLEIRPGISSMIPFGFPIAIHSGIPSGNPYGIPSGIFSGIRLEVPTLIHPSIFLGISSGIQSGIYPGIPSGIL